MEPNIWAETADVLTQKGVHAANVMLEARLRACACRRFDGLMGTEFTNDPADIANYARSFVTECSGKFLPVAAGFAMNDFCLNPERWFFDAAGYAECSSDPNDLDWLNRSSFDRLYDWGADEEACTTLIGLEPVQRAFSWYQDEGGYEEEGAQPAHEVAMLLTFVKFATLFERASRHPSFPTDTPILVTAYGFEIYWRNAAARWS